MMANKPRDPFKRLIVQFQFGLYWGQGKAVTGLDEAETFASSAEAHRAVKGTREVANRGGYSIVPLCR